MGNRLREKFIVSSGGLPIIPYGPGTPYATVNDLPDFVADAKLPILDKATGIVSACCWVFHNEGLDYVDCGRPTAVTDLLNPSNDFIVDVLTDCVNNGASSQFLVAFGNSTRQFTLYVSASGAFGCHIGNVLVQTSTSPITTVGWKHLTVVKSGSTISFYLDGVFLESKTASGTTITAENLFVNGSANNPECNTAWVIFKNASGAMVDCADFTDQTKWNGGTTGTLCSGSTFTVTKGSPTNERQKSAILRNKLVY